MAFKREELSQMAYTGAGTGNAFWFYTNSEEDTVTATNYFNDAADELQVGDLIYDVDGAGFVAVSAIAAGVVTVAVVPGS